MDVSPREIFRLSLSVSASLLGLRLHVSEAAVIVPCVLVSELILFLGFTDHLSNDLQ